jgi:hypothetical protein
MIKEKLHKDKIYTILILVLSIAIVFVLLYKFVIKRPLVIEGPKIENPEKITALRLDGSEVNLFGLISEKDECYCLLFELDNCQSCIYKGIVELETLEKEGKNCLGIAIHDWFEEIKGWSQHYKLKTFVVLKKVRYYEYIHSPHLPIIIKFKEGKINSYKYISP